RNVGGQFAARLVDAAPDGEAVRLVERGELDQLVRADLERAVDQLVVVRGDEGVRLARRGVERDGGAPAVGRVHGDARRASGQCIHIKEEAGAVPEAVRVVEVRGADRQVVGVDAVAHADAPGVARVDLPRGLVALGDGERAAFAVVGGDLLHVARIFADEIRAGRPYRELEVEERAARRKARLDGVEVGVAIAQLDRVLDGIHARWFITANRGGRAGRRRARAWRAGARRARGGARRRARSRAPAARPSRGDPLGRARRRSRRTGGRRTRGRRARARRRSRGRGARTLRRRRRARRSSRRGTARRRAGRRS